MSRYSSSAWRKTSYTVRFETGNGTCVDCKWSPQTEEEKRYLHASHNHGDPDGEVLPRCNKCHATFDGPWRYHLLLLKRETISRQLNLFNL